MKKNEFTLNTTVLSGQCDSLMRLRTEAILMSFQDVASRHAMFLGIDDFSLLEKDNAMWVITKTKVKINKLPLWNDDVSIRTWPMGADGVRCNRCYQIIKDNEILINGITEWVIIDATTRTLRKVETTSYPNDIDWITEKSIEEKFRRFKDDFTENDVVYKRLIRSGDIDVTHHTNNVTYITMLLDTFSVKELENMSLKEIEVSYINESFEGETLSIYRKKREDGTYFSIKKDDGKVVLMGIIL
ncbi:MAG: hypothetical protein E7066_04650 [Lentimicrobiaceae bacterium]|nr:hypothetical protein [Lentimicrobiaceae bacterium]